VGLSLGGIKGLFKKSAGGGGGDAINTANPIKTGQTISYATGDDGDLQEGRLTDFTTLDWTNPFGNTNRFTDELGGQTYANDIVIDWSTYNQVSSEVIGFYKGDSNTVRTWINAVNWGGAVSVSVYNSGWRLTNVNELFNILSFNSTSLLNYSPFNHTTALWTSTGFSSTAILVLPQLRWIEDFSKSNSYRTYASRTFTVSGTTLT